MTYPPENHRDSIGSTPIESDRKIVNGSILAITAFAIVVCGIAWYAVTGNRTGPVSINTPALQSPDGTTGYGAGQPKARVPNLSPK